MGFMDLKEKNKGILSKPLREDEYQLSYLLLKYSLLAEIWILADV